MGPVISCNMLECQQRLGCEVRYSEGEVPAADNIPTALPSKGAIKNSDNIQTQIDAAVKQTQVIGKGKTEQSAVVVVVVVVWVIAVVATSDRCVRSTDFLSFRDFERVDIRLSPAFEAEGSRGRGKQRNSRHEMHFKSN